MRPVLPSLLLVLALPAVASADVNDLVLGRLTNATTTGGMTRYVPQNSELRGLASELGVVLAPHLLTPADTLGFGGFQLTVDVSTTQINPDAPYWRARQADTGDGSAAVPGTLGTVGFFARKGLWFPIPSFEVGAGAVHLVDSRVWTGQLYAKFALVEGFHDLPLPSIAVRGGVSRMMTQHELDLTVASLDVVASKHLGIGGTWRLDPFVGYNLLVVVPRSEVIDPTPNVDQLVPGNEMDSQSSFVFREQDNIYRHRIFFGAKAQFSLIELTLEATFALAGHSTDNQSGTSEPCTSASTSALCDAKDSAHAQRTLSLSAGVDF